MKQSLGQIVSVHNANIYVKVKVKCLAQITVFCNLLGIIS